VPAFRSVVPPAVLQLRQLSVFYERENCQVDFVPVYTDGTLIMKSR
jgi:hypothetical protein